MQFYYAHIAYQPVFPLIVTTFNSFKRFVQNYSIMEDARRKIKLGDYKKPCEGLENFIISVTPFIWKNSDS